MRVIPVPCLSDNYAYLIVSPDGAAAAVVDPSEPEPVLRALGLHGLSPQAILCTHHHPDHVGGNLGILEKHPGLPVYGHESDLARGRIPGQTVGLSEGARIEVCGYQADILYIPGHTTGAVAYHFAAPGAVFTGDTLFGAGCGRLFEGTPAMMQPSLAKLTALPAATQIYCGHEYTASNLRFAAAVEPQSAAVRARAERVAALRAAGTPSVPSTVEEELQTNPFVRWFAKEVQAAAQKAEPALAQGAAADPVAIFGAIRRWKDRF